MRYIKVRNDVVVNIIEFGVVTPPEQDIDGDSLVLENPQGSASVGDVVDITDELRDRRITKFDGVILSELFRLTNLVRTLNGQATITAAQYRAFIKTQM